MSSDFSAGTRIRLAKRQISTIVEGEAVILQMDEGVYYGLNAVGTTVWKNLKNAPTFAELQALITSEFEVSDEDCAADLNALIGDLLKYQLVEVESEPAR